MNTLNEWLQASSEVNLSEYFSSSNEIDPNNTGIQVAREIKRRVEKDIPPLNPGYVRLYTGASAHAQNLHQMKPLDDGEELILATLQARLEKEEKLTGTELARLKEFTFRSLASEPTSYVLYPSVAQVGIGERGKVYFVDLAEDVFNSLYRSGGFIYVPYEISSQALEYPKSAFDASSIYKDVYSSVNLLARATQEQLPFVMDAAQEESEAKQARIKKC